MRLLADENCPANVVEALRAAGHDVSWVWEEGRGSSDQDVLARAQREQRVIATFDKDFGELAFRSRLPATSGILLFRLSGLRPERLATRVLDVVTSQASWQGVFASITEEAIRVRSLPAAAAD